MGRKRRYLLTRRKLHDVLRRRKSRVSDLLRAVSGVANALDDEPQARSAGGPGKLLVVPGYYIASSPRANPEAPVRPLWCTVGVSG